MSAPAIPASNLDRTLHDFGLSLQLPALRFNDAGVVMLTIQGVGEVFLQRFETDVVLCVARELHFPHVAHWKKALMLCHYENRHPFAVQVALKGEAKVGFLVRFTEEQFTPPAVERALEFLHELHGRLAAV